MKQTSQTAYIGTLLGARRWNKPLSGRPSSREKAKKVRALAWRAVETTAKAVKQMRLHRT